MPSSDDVLQHRVQLRGDAARDDAPRATDGGRLPPCDARRRDAAATQTPRFAIAAYAAAICTGVTAMPCPIGTLPIVEPDHLSGCSTKPGLSPGKSTPVVRAEPEAARSSGRGGRSELLGQRDRADVRRLREDLRDAHRLGAALLGVVDHAVGDVDRVRERELRLRRDEPVRERAGDRHELERRAGLVHVGHGAVARDVAATSTRTRSRRSRARPPSRAPSPVRGSSTTAVAPFACHFETVSRSTASAFAWIVWSIVRTTSSPVALGPLVDDVDHASERVLTTRSRCPACRRALVELELEPGEARGCRRPRSRGRATATDPCG